MSEIGSGTADRVAIVTDSTSDIPAHIALAEGIEIVPLTVTIDGESTPDGVLTQEEFFAKMRVAPRLPTTSQPPVGAFVEAYERALSAAGSVVSIHVSESLSGTIGSARQAAERFGGRVTVFDSRNLSWGLAFQVLEAARAAAEGLSATAVVERTAEVRDSVRLIVGLDSLDNLAKGGRIGRVSRFLGSMLDIKVLFQVIGGQFEPVKRVRGQAAALDATMRWVSEQMGGATSGAFAVLHALTEERAARLAESLRATYDASEMYVLPVGSVISTHTGTGWGVAFVPGVE